METIENNYLLGKKTGRMADQVPLTAPVKRNKG